MVTPDESDVDLLNSMLAELNPTSQAEFASVSINPPSKKSAAIDLLSKWNFPPAIVTSNGDIYGPKWGSSPLLVNACPLDFLGLTYGALYQIAQMLKGIIFSFNCQWIDSICIILSYIVS
jgi:hypothetical protein